MTSFNDLFHIPVVKDDTLRIVCVILNIFIPGRGYELLIIGQDWVLSLEVQLIRLTLWLLFVVLYRWFVLLSSLDSSGRGCGLTSSTAKPRSASSFVDPRYLFVEISYIYVQRKQHQINGRTFIIGNVSFGKHPDDVQASGSNSKGRFISRMILLSYPIQGRNTVKTGIC